MTISIKIISKEEFEKKNKKPNRELVWDNIADSWKEYRAREIPIIAEFLKNKKGKVIDLGCGAGRNMIPNKNIEYYGVDFSEKMIKNAEKFIKINKINAKLFKSMIDNLDKKIFDNEMFDYGLFIASLHCLETREERENALKEFYRILKKGSEALISVWDSEDFRFKNKGKEVYMSWKKDGISYMRYYYLYNKQELLDLLKSVGFRILEIYDIREKDRFSKKNFIIKIRK